MTYYSSDGKKVKEVSTYGPGESEGLVIEKSLIQMEQRLLEILIITEYQMILLVKPNFRMSN